MADYYDTIGRLYTNVLYEDIRNHQLTQADIRTGIQNMKEVYKPNPMGLKSDIVDVANYNDPAHRCAYLHKYAPLHTALVRDMLAQSMQQVRFLLQDILRDAGRIEICSLGGGPGSDVLGVISVLSAELGFFQLSATIIDCMENWKYTFATIIKELRYGYYGFISDFVQPKYFSWNYIGHNLLGKMCNDANKAIQGANLITMVKFVSAAACKDTAEMVKKIFRSLKPGALVLFIDNAAGGFYKLMIQGAQESGMISVFGPLTHEHYTNMSFNVRRFGYTPCLETKVTVHMWMKPNYYRPNILSNPSLGSSSRVQTRNVTNTVNQYNIINTNIYVSETNNLNLPFDNPHQNFFHNTTQNRTILSQKVENQSSLTPIHKQSQDHTLPSSTSSKTKDSNLVHNATQNRTILSQNVENQSSLKPIHKLSQDHTLPSSTSSKTKDSNLHNTAQKKTVISSRQNAGNRSSHTIQIQPQGNILPSSSHETNLKLPHNIPQKKKNSNPRQQNGENQSSHITYQRQPQYHSLPDRAPHVNQNNIREEREVDCCNCCVIS